MFQRYILIVFIALSGNAVAQTNTGEQVWIDYNHKNFVRPNLALGGDAGFRADISSGDWYALYIRPRITYRLNQTFSFVGGVALFQNWNPSLLNNIEFRIEQQVTAKWPNFKNLHFENRLRFEERYFNYRETAELNIPDKWTVRIRYQLMLKSDYFSVSEKLGNLYALLAAETFIPFQNAHEQSKTIRERFVLGFGQLLPKGSRYEVNIILQVPLNGGSDGANTNLWMLRLRYYLQKNSFKG